MNRRRIDNTMAKRKSTKGHTMIYKTRQKDREAERKKCREAERMKGREAERLQYEGETV
jgi:hypothetical protein